MTEVKKISREPPLRYRAEKRRDHGISMVPPLLSSVSQGGFTGIFFYFGHITAIAFSYIRTTFGASRSMRVGVRLDKQLEVSDPCVFGYIFSENVPI